MAPLIVLLTVFSAGSTIKILVHHRTTSYNFIGRLAMSCMLIVTGLAHFFKSALMIQSLPAIVPFKETMVYLTGVIELVAAIGLLTDRFARITSLLLMVFFVCILPANIIGSLKHVALGGMENGPNYLWFRIPLQIFFIGWVYYFGFKKVRANSIINED
jgi:uncharacterized membrane protein